MKRKVPYLKFIIPRRRGVTVRLGVLALWLCCACAAWPLSCLVGDALRPPRPSQSLDHLRLSRSLKSYLDPINTLIEPSSTACSLNQQVEVLVLVTSSPKRFAQRQAIRDTWGKHVPTYFVLGLDGPTVEDLMVDNYIEAKMYSDMIVFEFKDHYQNLTLKSALMLQWAVERCAHHLEEMMLFKTDDDVLVNPWILRKVVQENSEKDLVGYRKLNSYPHRDETNKWYLPRWLYWQDRVPEYLSGTGYLIHGSKLNKILNAAYEVPIINLEDVYFTYLVSEVKLGLTLTHDHRLSPYRPWLPLPCLYWGLASTHSLSPNEMLCVWPNIEGLGKQYEKGDETCKFYVDNVWSEWYLY